MLKVKISANANYPYIRQTPNRSGEFSDVKFIINDDSSDGPFDAWFVLEEIPHQIKARCANNNIVFVPYEPAGIRDYDTVFLKQFGVVLTFRSDIRHANLIHTHQILPWWIGTSGGHGKKIVNLDYDALVASTVPQKVKTISCVCSDKAITVDHRQRLHFVRELKIRLGEQLQVFGPGFGEWPDERQDKWETIAPYQYHLAIENSAHKGYWTEKVADTFLGGAFLIYWGCPNLGDYFREDSFLQVDRSDPDAAAATISRLLDSDGYFAAESAIAESREAVLNKYNLFAELAAFAKNLPHDKVRKVTLRPEEEFRNSFTNRVRSIPNRLANRILRKNH